MIDLSMLTGSRLDRIERWTAMGTEDEFNSMLPRHREQVLFLDAASTRAAYELEVRNRMVCGDAWGNDPFGEGCYREVERYVIPEEAAMKKWLYRRGLPFAAEVLLLPIFGALDEPAVLTTWKIVVKYAGSIFSHDNLIVFGASVDWCLYYHHDDILYFARGRNRQVPS
ncbi:MAG TPA: hypothetical protein VGR37_20345 [Longimicrobiaceae bacterium]|nr:hypothetical protein [Longimicrobiaceae bacterium]